VRKATWGGSENGNSYSNVWAGKHLPDPTVYIETVGISPQDPSDSRTLQERRATKFLGRTILLPGWRDVEPTMQDLLMFFDEPEF
jgi:ABC-type uncharacterized transport system YnjBCD substrate-binding protein